MSSLNVSLIKVGLLILNSHTITVRTKKYAFLCLKCSKGFLRLDRLKQHTIKYHLLEVSVVCQTDWFLLISVNIKPYLILMMLSLC